MLRDSLTRPFAVIDLETTGLIPSRDRIIEIAIILTDEHLNIDSTWSTLINPNMPVTGTQIHGISDADVTQAPQFADVSTQVHNLLKGRVIVAHNAAFDVSFLNAEFKRNNLPHSIPLSAVVCTMDQSHIYSESKRHSLAHLAQFHSVDYEQRHRAIFDAKACLGLLEEFAYREQNNERVCNCALNRRGEKVLPGQWLRAHAWAGN
ncbi:3'-5' exonuclease [Arcanobacterium ihumii]|uniref:3'-5' exonuclease n=1 Tax=Arcanobacterium ihumii TaxID=2138162 RepID=UPI00135AFB56|nr:3'-5' exonuclease [Arcanobacterium ihumii]